MKTSFKKIASLILAIIMVAGLVPATVFAKTETITKIEDNLNELDLLLSMDSLNGDNLVAKEGSDYAFASKYAQNGLAPVAGSGAVAVTSTVTNGDSWVGYVGETNIPLKGAETKYVISFNARTNIVWRLFGFAFCQPNSGDSKGQQQVLFAYSENKAYVAYGQAWSTYFIDDHKTDYVYDGTTAAYTKMDSLSQTHAYLIVLSGTNVLVYVDKELVGTFSVESTGYNTENLALGIRMRANNKTINGAGLNANEPLMYMENIKVYEGEYKQTIVTEEIDVPDDPVPEEGEEILHIDNLMGEGFRSNYGYTFTRNTSPQGSIVAIPEGEAHDGVYSIEQKNSPKNGMWYNYGGQTSIPLTATSKYTVEFQMRNDYKQLNGGFSWSYSANGDAQGIYYYANSISNYYGYTIDCYKHADGTAASVRPSFTNLWTACADDDGYTTFTIEINGMEVTAYVGGVRVGVYDFSSTDDAKASKTWQANLALTTKGRCFDESSARDEGTKLVSVKNITVYNGLKITNKPMETGDLLLHLDNLTGEGASSNYGYTYIRNGAQNVNLTADPTDVNETVYGVADTDGGKAWYLYGGQTTIPLDGESKYTIEFYMLKNFANLNAGFTWSFTANNNAQGFYYYANSVNTYHGYNIGYYKKSDGGTGTFACTNLWKEYANNDGYTRFTIEIDGYNATIYVGGAKVGTYNFDAPTNTSKANAKWNSAVLSLAAKGRRFPEAPELEENGALVSVKDINVYYGNVAQNHHVSFMYGDTVVKTQTFEPGSKIETFPTVDVTPADDQVLVWFHKNTNVVVQAPYTVVGDATLEARLCNAKSIHLEGAQYTAVNAETNTQNVRFIASLFSLNAQAAGFEIEAKYMDNGTLVTKKWTRNTSVVYTAINTTSNGTVKSVTAQELGALYLVALSVDNVPTNVGQIDFYIRAYIIVNGEKIYSDDTPGTFTMKDGKNVSNAELLK